MQFATRPKYLRRVLVATSIIATLAANSAVLCVLADTPATGAADSSNDSADSSTGLTEIVVTAQKSRENLQSVPIAVSALGEKQLADRQIVDLGGLAASIPNFSYGEYNGNASISIRGLGYNSINPGADPRVAAHLDGVYIARPAAATASFYDIERVEVLRGPQGTLYGRNATAGSVNIITADPTEQLSGYSRLTVGTYGRVTEEGALSGGLAPGLTARVAGQVNLLDGYGRDIITNHGVDSQNTRSLRAKIRYAPTETFELMLSGDYHHEDDTNYALHFIRPLRADTPIAGLALGGILPDNTVRDVANSSDPVNRRTFWGLAANAALYLDSITLRSITGYRNSRTYYEGLFDGLSGNFNLFTQHENSETISEELQISHDGEKLKWIGGLFYFHENGDSHTQIPCRGDLFGLAPIQFECYWAGGDFTTSTAAAFGQATYRFTPDISLTLGERYGWERKTKYDGVQFDLTRPFTPETPIIPNSVPFSSAATSVKYDSPKVTLNYEPSKTVLAYATVARGFKSGGFDIGGGGPAFKPEKLTDYELGVKADYLDGHLRTNLSAFYYKYTDIQLPVVRDIIIGIVNAASSTMKGMEAEISALPITGLEVSFAGGYLDTKYKDFSSIDSGHPELGLQDLASKRMILAPKYTGDLGLQYTWSAARAGEFSIRGDWKYKSKIYFTPFNTEAESSPGHSTVDVNANWKDESGAWSVGLYGKNVTNKVVLAYELTCSQFMGWPEMGSYEPPATFGVTVGYRF